MPEFEQARVEQCLMQCPLIKDNLWWKQIAADVATAGRNREAFAVANRGFQKACAKLLETCTIGPQQTAEQIIVGPARIGERREFDCSGDSVAAIKIIIDHSHRIDDLMQRNVS